MPITLLLRNPLQLQLLIESHCYHYVTQLLSILHKVWFNITIYDVGINFKKLEGKLRLCSC